MAGKIYIDAFYRDKMSGPAQQSTEKVTSSFKKMAKTIATVAGIATAGIALQRLGRIAFDLTKSFISVGAQTEKWQLQLRALTQDVGKAKEKWDYLYKLAGRIPFTLEELITASITMEGFGYDVEKYMESIVDAAAVNKQGLLGTVEAFTSATSGILRTIKTNFGIAAQEIERVIGHRINTGTRKGMLEVADALDKIFKRRFPGLAKELATTWDGTVSMLQDAWFQFRDAVAEAGFFDDFKTQLQDVLKFVEEKKESGEWDKWAQKTSDALETAGKKARFTAEQWGQLIEAWQKIEKVGKPLSDFLNQMANVNLRKIGSAEAWREDLENFDHWVQGTERFQRVYLEGLTQFLAEREERLAELSDPWKLAMGSVFFPRQYPGPKPFTPPEPTDWKPWFEMLSKGATDMDKLHAKWLEMSGLAKEFKAEGIWDYELPPSAEALEESRIRITAWATLWKGADVFFQKQMDGWNSLVMQATNSLQSGFRRVLETGMNDWKGFWDAMKDMVLDFVAFLAAKAALFTFLNWMSGGTLGKESGGFFGWLGFPTGGAGTAMPVGGGMGTLGGTAPGGTQIILQVTAMDAKSFEDWIVFGEGRRVLDRWGGAGY